MTLSSKKKVLWEAYQRQAVQSLKAPAPDFG
jgi:hypothetical protein